MTSKPPTLRLIVNHEPLTQPEGRSWLVKAPNPRVAERTALRMARTWCVDARTARVLHLEEVVPGAWEVVIQVGWLAAVS